MGRALLELHSFLMCVSVCVSRTTHTSMAKTHNARLHFSLTLVQSKTLPSSGDGYSLRKPL